MLQEMSPKQKQSLRESDARINVWVGAVRSGKTYSSIWRFIEYIKDGPPGDLMIIGKSLDTVKRNILSELYNFLGVDVRYYGGDRYINLWGRKIWVVGANDERAVQKIQGSTLSGAYVDEAALIPESFWVMLMSRLSPPGAKVFATTNPDSPFHWLKEILDDNELNLKKWHFTLEDNPALDENYKKNLKKEYKGLWYQRYIEGLWVLAEGTIYDFFDPKLHVVPFVPSYRAKYYIAGIDYGTTNPCAFTLIGYNPDQYPNMWVEKEYYWDSVKEHRQKTDTEYAEDLLKFISDLPSSLKNIYLDPSAASFKAELIRQGVRNIAPETNNDILDGIRFVSGLLSNGALRIHGSCKNMIKEFGSYVWNSKSRERGIDEPIKRSDHLLDSLRYALFTHFGSNLGSENRMTPDKLKEMKRKWGFY